MMDRPSASVSPDRSVRERFSEALALLDADPRDRRAVSLLEENIVKGCMASIVLLGDVFADGDERERAESVKLFRRAAALGDPSGMRNLGYCYSLGINVAKDKSEGARWYTEAAEAGNARAMCNIGVMYSYGNGVPKSDRKAFGWYLRSAEAGYPRGMTNVGLCYLLGKGTDCDKDEAEKWLRRSGSPRANYHLAHILLDIRGENKEGLEFLRRSAEAGYTKAMYWYAMEIEEQDPGLAVDLLKKAADKGNAEAAAELAKRI